MLLLQMTLRPYMLFQAPLLQRMEAVFQVQHLNM